MKFIKPYHLEEGEVVTRLLVVVVCRSFPRATRHSGSLSGPPRRGGCPAKTGLRTLARPPCLATPSNCGDVHQPGSVPSERSVRRRTLVAEAPPIGGEASGMVTTRSGRKGQSAANLARHARRASPQTERRWVLSPARREGLRYSRRTLECLVALFRRAIHRSVGEPAEGSLTRNAQTRALAELAPRRANPHPLPPLAMG